MKSASQHAWREHAEIEICLMTEVKTQLHDRLRTTMRIAYLMSICSCRAVIWLQRLNLTAPLRRLSEAFPRFIRMDPMGLVLPTPSRLHCVASAVCVEAERHRAPIRKLHKSLFVLGCLYTQNRPLWNRPCPRAGSSTAWGQQASWCAP